MATKLTTQEFAEKAKKVHKDRYDYSKVNYVNSKQKVCIVCPKHGEFWQTPNSHLLGKGCPKCAVKNKPQCNPKTTEQFIEEAKKVHNSFYSYPRTSYVTAGTKVIITCPIHGDFEQTPNSHLNGQGCPKCAHKGINTEEFIQRSKQIHGNMYDYSKTVYVNSHSPVTITCPIHGDFEQRPCDHIHQKQGCPKCSLSKGELQVAQILNDLGINYTQQYAFEFNNRKFYIDFSFYLNGKFYFVEYNGRQHYIPVDYFGGKLAFDKQIKRDQEVRDYCKKFSINLIELRYDDKDIKNTILQALNDNTCKTCCKGK